MSYIVLLLKSLFLTAHKKCSRPQCWKNCQPT